MKKKHKKAAAKKAKNTELSAAMQEFNALCETLSIDEQFNQTILLIEWFFGRSTQGGAV